MSLSLNTKPAKSGLIFDADGMAIIGRYGDEVAAYRARRTWMALLKEEFLLDKERDYEMTVLRAQESGFFLLGCTFVSACGRYAFWRLINHQVPEAEDRLAGRAPRRRASAALLEALSLWNKGEKFDRKSALDESDRMLADGKVSQIWGKLHRMFN